MIDHVLGRPSVKFRKTQVFAVVAFWSLYLLKGHAHGPPFVRRISRKLSARITSWQTIVLTLLYLYVSRNFGKVAGLECPEPLANLYTRSYFRATWVTTALDAGFWTAMNIRPKWLKDLSSVIFTVYYLVCAEQADEKVRKVRSGLTLQHLRVSWNKPTTPYISFFTNLLRPVKHKYPPRELAIPRPAQSSYREPVRAWLYFDGPLSKLTEHDKIILDIPGGGFVAMDPKCHEDKLIGWAGRTGLPVLALDYRKAPEYPYPYALNECYDVYHTLLQTRGKCIGLAGDTAPKIVVSGDSAGGNLAVGMVLMILQAGTSDTRRFLGEMDMPVPDGLVLIYPALDMNIGNWMTDEQMALIKDRRSRKTNQGVIRRKSDDYRKLTPETPHGSDDEEEESPAEPLPKILSKPTVASPMEPNTAAAHTIDAAALQNTEAKPAHLKTRLAMSSMISYFNDRILTPEMMRAMIILYIGPHSRPDFATDFLLSPLLAPEALLAQFPKTYFLTGERDPLVDDTVIFAGRIRQAKMVKFEERKELGLVASREKFKESDWVNVALVPGISHGFLQFVSVFPEGWRHIMRCARWMNEIFDETDRKEHAAAGGAPGKSSRLRINSHAGQQDYFDNAQTSAPPTGASTQEDRFYRYEDDELRNLSESSPERERRHHRRMRTGSSGDEDKPLEMTSIRASPRPGSRKSDDSRNGTPSKANGSTATVIAAGRPPNGTPERPGRGRGASNAKEGTGAYEAARRRDKTKSIVSLASSDDLLGRRMKGLTGNLMGRINDGDVETP